MFGVSGVNRGEKVIEMTQREETVIHLCKGKLGVSQADLATPGDL